MNPAAAIARSPVQAPAEASHAKSRTPVEQLPGPVELAASLAWLIELRWIALLGVVVALVAGAMLGWMDDLVAPMMVAGGLALFNLWRWLGLRETPPEARTRSQLERALLLQLHVDLVALTLLLYWTGGTENPFVLYYVFPVALAAMLHSARGAFRTVGTAFLLYGTLIVSGNLAAVPHRPLLPVLRLEGAVPGHYDLLGQPVYIAAVLVAVGSTLLGVVYFLQTVVQLQRRTEERRRQHERVARSRERLARVGTLAAGLAHSIRNPLHGMFNCLDLLGESVDGEEGRATLGLMREGLRRVENVTNRLLTLTRETPIRLVRADVNDQVRDTLRFFDGRVRERRLTLGTELTDLPAIPLDVDRFHEALFNIIDNALDAVEGRSGRVVVRSRRISEPFEGVTIEVEDNGTGIDETVQDRLFDPFFTTKAIGAGSGLGLAIARRVVEAHGGEIELWSRLGEGTIVRVTLPLEHPDPGGGGRP